MKIISSTINSILLLTIALIQLTSCNSIKEDTPPNIVFILADDCSFSTLACYGGQNVQTPNIDRLANEGLKFTQAFSAMSMCVPFRAELYTGLYPFRNGCVWNHATTSTKVRTAPQVLVEMGYRVGLSGKRHYHPESHFPFEMVPGLEKKTSIKNNLYEPWEMESFMTRDADQPFVLYVNSIYPHRPWTDGDVSKFDPATLTLPEGLADTPIIRKELADYLAEVAKLDHLVGEVLSMLTKNGLDKNTVVMFSSEQGWEFPGGKYTCWDQGLHTALIARWPGHIKAGQQTDALVQICDLLPTFIELAGGTPDTTEFDGRSLVNVLKGKTDKHRDYAYGIHHNIPSKNPYPIRTIYDGTYRYINNLESDLKYTSQSKRDWFVSLEEAANKGDEQAALIIKRTVNRPAEELYLSNEDPYELVNLAGNPKYSKIKKELRDELDAWRKDQHDQGSTMDSREFKKKKKTEWMPVD